jgi:hypothetical protein
LKQLQELKQFYYWHLGNDEKLDVVEQRM